MRAAMPVITAWIDDLRAAFGADVIDGQIRKSMPGTPEQVARGERGQPTFYARENGHEVGTPKLADGGTAVQACVRPAQLGGK